MEATGGQKKPRGGKTKVKAASNQYSGLRMPVKKFDREELHRILVVAGEMRFGGHKSMDGV